MIVTREEVPPITASKEYEPPRVLRPNDTYSANAWCQYGDTFYYCYYGDWEWGCTYG